MLQVVKEYFNDFFNLFYPDICVGCSNKLLKGENIISFRCEQELPQTEHWDNPENALAKRFWGRVNVRGSVALYHFKKGSQVQHLLHQLKYKGRKEIGELLGKILGSKIIPEASVIKEIDLIVPVPLHWKKFKMRGYNQCDSLAGGLSESLGVPWSASTIERVHENISQTKKKKFDRWGNVAEIFSIKDEQQLKGKHILLVDDVVTTGATAEACLSTILKAENATVSFAAIATA